MNVDILGISELKDLLELTPKKDVLFIIGDWNAKVGQGRHNEGKKQACTFSRKSSH